MFSQADQLSFQTKEWSAIPRISHTVPFGYREHPEDSSLLQPVILELEALEKAKVHLKQFSYREVANWLSEVTGRRISHMGLKKRIENERRRKQKATTLRKWAEWVEEAREKAEKYDKERLGASREAPDQLEFDL